MYIYEINTYFMKTRKVYRDAGTGIIVPEEYTEKQGKKTAAYPHTYH